MQALIVEIDEYGVHALHDAMDSAVMQVQETQRALVAGFAFDGRHCQHVLQVQNVGVEVRAVHPISHVAGQVREVGVADVILDLDVLNRKGIDFRVDALGRAILIPTSGRHFDTSPVAWRFSAGAVVSALSTTGCGCPLEAALDAARWSDCLIMGRR